MKTGGCVFASVCVHRSDSFEGLYTDICSRRQNK